MAARRSSVTNFDAGPEPVVSLVTVTPEMATKYIEANEHNRILREDRAIMLAGLLKMGEWHLSDSAIVIDYNGKLINGQHRLSAIIISGVPAQLIVLENAVPESQDIMDTGAKRSTADALTIRGYHDVFVLQSALNWTHRLNYIEATGAVHYGTASQRPNTPTLLRILEQNPFIEESCRRSRLACTGSGLRRGVGAAVYNRCMTLSADDTEDFFNKLATGADIKARTPIFALRKQLLADGLRNGRTMPDYRQAALLCKAWNLYRDGAEVQILHWNFGGSGKSDPFPIPR